jgi:hypothetical protein
MEIDTVSVAQSHAIKEINAIALDKSLAQRDELSKKDVNNSMDKSSHYSEPNKGQYLDLFA